MWESLPIWKLFWLTNLLKRLNGPEKPSLYCSIKGFLIQTVDE